MRKKFLMFLMFCFLVGLFSSCNSLQGENVVKSSKLYETTQLLTTEKETNLTPKTNSGKSQEITPLSIVKETNGQDISVFFKICESLGVVNIPEIKYVFIAKTKIVFENDGHAIVATSLGEITDTNKAGFLFCKKESNKWVVENFYWYDDRDNIVFELLNDGTGDVCKDWLVIRRTSQYGTGVLTLNDFWYDINGREVLSYPVFRSMFHLENNKELSLGVRMSSSVVYGRRLMDEGSFSVVVNYGINAFDMNVQNYDDNGLLFQTRKLVVYKWDDDTRGFLYDKEGSTTTLDHCMSIFEGKSAMMEDYKSEIYTLKDANEQYKRKWYSELYNTENEVVE